MQDVLSSTRYSCQILTKLEFSRQIFEKSSSIRFNKNLSSGSRVVECGHTDMSELKVAFQNSVNASKNPPYTETLK